MVGQILVAAGFLLMAYNVVRALMFARSVGDVLVGERGRAWSIIVVAFLVFFAIVYAFIFFQDFEEVSIGVILLSGSMFVTFVLLWIIRLVGTVKDSTMGMAGALSTVIEARDPNLKGHSRHVQRLTGELYEALPDHMRRQLNKTNLEYAALFHDLGKLGVSESILNKPGKLTPEEWDIMLQHPQIGVQIIEPVGSFDDISDWILYHHERVDGKGYYKLPGDQIPLGARVIAVADVFSAIFMRRPYKDAANYEECIAELKRSAGTQLDAEIVEAFCSIPRATVLTCGRDLVDVDTRS
ncbi:MAG: HD domain-containing protein [Eggerthellaceae bacterium]|nr:HD domain-containing protein [Eggerthellaceae bacterium]